MYLHHIIKTFLEIAVYLDFCHTSSPWTTLTFLVGHILCKSILKSFATRSLYFSFENSILVNKILFCLYLSLLPANLLALFSLIVLLKVLFDYFASFICNLLPKWLASFRIFQSTLGNLHTEYYASKLSLCYQSYLFFSGIIGSSKCSSSLI